MEISKNNKIQGVKNYKTGAYLSSMKNFRASQAKGQGQSIDLYFNN
jgi:hypothetical protein